MRHVALRFRSRPVVLPQHAWRGRAAQDRLPQVTSTQAFGLRCNTVDVISNTSGTLQRLHKGCKIYAIFYNDFSWKIKPLWSLCSVPLVCLIRSSISHRRPKAWALGICGGLSYATCPRQVCLAQTSGRDQNLRAMCLMGLPSFNPLKP